MLLLFLACLFFMISPTYSQTVPSGCFDYGISADESGENVATLRCAGIPIFKFKNPGTYEDITTRAETYARRMNNEFSTYADLATISFDLKKVFAVTAVIINSKQTNNILLYEIIPEDVSYYSQMLREEIQMEAIGTASMLILRDALAMILYKMPPLIIGSWGDGIMQRVYERIGSAGKIMDATAVGNIIGAMNENEQSRFNNLVFSFPRNAADLTVGNAEFQDRVDEFTAVPTPSRPAGLNGLQAKMREINIYFENAQKALLSDDGNNALEPLESIRVLVPLIADHYPPENAEQITQFMRCTYAMDMTLDGMIKNIKNNLYSKARASLSELKSACNNCHQLFGSNFTVN